MYCTIINATIIALHHCVSNDQVMQDLKDLRRFFTRDTQVQYIYSLYMHRGDSYSVTRKYEEKKIFR